MTLCLANVFGIEPHLLLLIHVSKQHHLVLVGDVFPGGVMLAVPAKQVGKVALLIVTAEIHAHIFLQFPFLGEGSGHGSAFFHVE